MVYSRFAEDEEIKNVLTRVTLDQKIEKSGIPVLYGKNEGYITKSGHSIVIGSTGSGKTQSVVLPLVKLSILAEESLIINDPQGEIYHKTASEFKARNYNVVLLDFKSSIYGNYWNPLDLAYDLYQSGDKDGSVDIIENIGKSIFEEKNNNVDPFWNQSATDLFTGVALYFCNQKKKSETTIDNIYKYATDLMKKENAEKFISEIGNRNASFYSLNGILFSPVDTKGSIYSVFSQKMKLITSRENLSNTLSKTDFDLKDISKEKTVIYILNDNSRYSSLLTPMFINQAVNYLTTYGNKKKFNIILDQFDMLDPIDSFVQLLNNSSAQNVNFTIIISSYLNLKNTYGSENAEIIKLCFSNIIYLYTNDLFTIEDISKQCGNIQINGKYEPLITVQELQTFKNFQALFLMNRMFPYKTELVPDYEINWGFNTDEANFVLKSS